MNGKMSALIIRDVALTRGVEKITALKIAKLRNESKREMWEYYLANKAVLPEYIREFREEIIVELMKGRSAEEAFGSIQVFVS